jgi:hypothetical protein
VSSYLYGMNSSCANSYDESDLSAYLTMLEKAVTKALLQHKESLHDEYNKLLRF